MKIPFRIRIKLIRIKHWLLKLLSLERKSQFIYRDGRKLGGFLFVAVLLLSACGSVQVGVEQTPGPAASVSTEPSLNPEPTLEEQDPTPEIDGNDGPGPDLFMVPYAAGAGEGENVIQVENGVIKYSESPVSFALFFDYSSEIGQIVYGSEFWHAAEGSNVSVSDLWVFDYASAEESRLLADNVGRALFSPPSEIEDGAVLLAAVVYNTDTERFDLAIVDDAGNLDVLASCVSPSFSWSADGSRIAYEARDYTESSTIPDDCEGVFVVSLADRSVTKIADQPPSLGGWHGGQPVWAEGRQTLLIPYSYPESVFAAVPLDGSGVQEVNLSASITEEYLPQPLLSLWSQEYNSVIGQTEGMMDPFGVWVYQFSEDMRTIEDAYRIQIDGRALDLILVGWWETGESVLLRDISNMSELNQFGRGIVWSLGERTWREVPDNIDPVEVKLHDADTRSGVAEVDRVIDAFLAGDVDARLDLLSLVRADCVAEDFGVGPPQCPAGTPVGTEMEVFPYRQYRETEFATGEQLRELLDFGLEGLYAVLPIRDGFEETWWPAGEHNVVFVSNPDANAVEVIVNQDGEVVRIEFIELSPVEILFGYDGEFLVAPLE